MRKVLFISWLIIIISAFTAASYADSAEKTPLALQPDKPTIKHTVKTALDVETGRKYILIEGGERLKTSAGASYETASNGTNVTIPESDWGYSDIYINSAPGGAVVSGVDVHYEIIHMRISDLLVDVSDGGLVAEYPLWDCEGGSAHNINETETGITVFNDQAVNQYWTLWAMDVCSDYTGYIDYWWIKVYYETTVPPPPNDDCIDANEVTEDIVYEGSTVGATGSTTSGCGYNDNADVWYHYTPTCTATATISLLGSAFDTTLSVYDSCGGTELACNDDYGETYQSRLIMSVTAGETYYIRIAGYNDAVGDYDLEVTAECGSLPPAPDLENPSNAADSIPPDTMLSWNGGIAKSKLPRDEKSKFPSEIEKVIYGADDRLDHYQVSDPDLLAVGDSTVAILSASELTYNGDGTYSLPPETFAQYYLWSDPIGTGNPLCPDEPFRDQPSPALCSGFLVAPDIVATAGHCADPGSCGDIAFVFGFVMLDASTPVLTVDACDVYYCSEIIATQTGSSDWAMVRLDRPVIGHTPLSVRSEGEVAEGDPLVVIGHPFGIPRKYAGGATVRDNSAASSFEANLDTLAGNSGSAVFNANTLVVEGILVAGNEDFVEDGTCDRSNVCPDSGCPTWEIVTRTTEFADLIDLTTYDVYFDTVNPPSAKICGDIAQPQCDPTPTPGELLSACETYYWKVVAKNRVGQTEGDVWSFKVLSVAGDFDQNCAVDYDDLKTLATYWLTTEPLVDIYPAPDGDGSVNFYDFDTLADNWQAGPGQ